MTYYADTHTELARAGICQDELALYTGTNHSGLWSGGGPDCAQNVYVYRWDEGRAVDVPAEFEKEDKGPEILDVTVETDRYLFLRDRETSLIRQLAGPARPIVAANLGGAPLRVDTFLGKFTVHGGSIIRLDQSVPRREKRTVLLVFDPGRTHTLTRALLRDGGVWTPLNISPKPGDPSTLSVMDGNVLVQRLRYYARTDGAPSVHLEGPAEPDPDHQVFVTAAPGSDAPVKLWFKGLGYEEGLTVWQARRFTLSPGAVYDLQRLRTACSVKAMELCTVDLPAADALPALNRAPSGPSEPDGGPDDFPDWDFPDDSNTPDEPPFTPFKPIDEWEVTLHDEQDSFPPLDG